MPTKETIRRRAYTSKQTPRPRTSQPGVTSKPVATKSRSNSTAFEITAAQFEWTVWAILLVFCAWRRKFYWKVVFVSAFVARISYIAAFEGFQRLPASCATLPNMFLWLSWLSVCGICLTTSVYCFFLTPFHLYWSPMDLWAKYDRNPAPQKSFDILHDPGPFTRAELIAVHGLGSNPHTAWAHRASPTSSPVKWLQDFLPKEKKLKGLKIIQVNHQTTWHANVSVTAFNDHARNILQDIESAHARSGRPIIFVAHSFGGLLLKRALVLAKNESSVLAEDTRGILFLGVPHRGTEAAFWASLLSCTAKWRGSSTTLLEYINKESEFVEENDDFRSAFVLHRPDLIQHLPRICDFVEQRPEKAWKLALGATVNRKSGYSRYGHSVMLDTDHRGLNKFSSSIDPNFVKVLEQLEVTFEYALKTGALTQNIEPDHNVPFSQDMNFVQRQVNSSDIIETIHSRLFRSPPRHKRIALVGLGGMGKSQIAIEFAYMVREKYPNTWVFWVRAGNKVKFESSYCDIAQQVGIVSPDDTNIQGNILGLVLKWLKNEYNGRWVMILDGVEDVNFLPSLDSSPEEVPITSFLPRVNHGVILITSRVRTAALRVIATTDEFDNIILIDSMNSHEAENLLRSRLPMHLWDLESAKLLLNQLENVPLAITQAAAVINHLLLDSISDYISRFSKRRIQRESVPDPRRDQERSSAVFVTWQLSFAEIEDRSSSAIELLSYMSTLDHESIPRELLDQYRLGESSHFDIVEDPVAYKYEHGKNPVKTNEEKADKEVTQISWLDVLQGGIPIDWESYLNDQFEADLRLLCDFAMIQKERSGSSYSMHRLVQQAISDWLLEQGGDMLRTYQMKAVTNLSMAFPNDAFNNINVAYRIYRHAEKVLIYPCTGRLPLIHRAELLYRMSDYYDSNGSRTRALQLAIESLQIRENLFTGYNICTTYSLLQCSRAYLSIEDFRMAEGLQRKALDGWSVSMGFANHLKADLQASLVVGLISQGKLEEAIKVFGSMSISDPRWETQFERVKADLFRGSDLFEEAKNVYEQIIESVKSWGDSDRYDSQLLVACQWGLAICLEQVEGVEAAANMLRNAVARALTNPGPAEPITIKLIACLGFCLKECHNYVEAENILRDALDLAEAHYDGHDPIFFETLAALSGCLSKQEKWRELEELLEDVNFKDRNPMYEGQIHFWQTRRLALRASWEMGRVKEAKTAYEQMISETERIAGTQSSIYISACLARANYLLELGETKEVQEELDKFEWCLHQKGPNLQDAKLIWIYVNTRLAETLSTGKDKTGKNSLVV